MEDVGLFLLSLHENIANVPPFLTSFQLPWRIPFKIIHHHNSVPETYRLPNYQSVLLDRWYTLATPINAAQNQGKPLSPQFSPM